MAPDPLRDRAREMGPSLAFHTIADESYVNSVQLPLSGIPGSAPGLPDKLGRFGIDANHSKWFEPRSITSSYCVIVGGGGGGIALKRTVVGKLPSPGRSHNMNYRCISLLHLGGGFPFDTLQFSVSHITVKPLAGFHTVGAWVEVRVLWD